MDSRDYLNIFETKISEYKLIPANSFLFVLDSGGKDSSAMSSLFKEYAKEKVWDLVNHDTYKKMLSVLKEKTDNFNEALEKVKKMDYSELLL